MGIKFYDSNGKYWGEYDETRSLFIPSEETITQTETQNSNLTFEKRTMRDRYNCKRYRNDEKGGVVNESTGGLRGVATGL